jgi:hypothetical protein
MELHGQVALVVIDVQRGEVMPHQTGIPHCPVEHGDVLAAFASMHPIAAGR